MIEATLWLTFPLPVDCVCNKARPQLAASCRKRLDVHFTWRVLYNLKIGWRFTL